MLKENPKYPPQMAQGLTRGLCPSPRCKSTSYRNSALPRWPHTRLGEGNRYLQCTTMGPASGGLQVFTRLRKARNGVGYSGTPWSGQAVNWNWRTSRFSLEPFCRGKVHQESGRAPGPCPGCVWRASAAHGRGRNARQLTLWRENVRTQNVANSMVSSNVT